MSVLIETTLGDIVVDLFVNERKNCCRNFLKLCKIKYYNLCQIFNIETNYIARMGDPTNTGRGGESIFGILYGEQARYFEMELVPKMKHMRKGLLAMVNNGSDMLGSQFFITLADRLDYLDGKHCIFGQVSEGMEVVNKINEELVDPNHRPYRDLRVAHTTIIYDPFEDPPNLHIPSRSPSPTSELLKLENQMALDESVNEDEGKTAEEIREELEQKDMNAQAQILEMVGDLHYADEKPPDNVLFVCKLNPVTTDEDLEVIFSRHGAIACCEVIKDRRTGASLQYAFIEFEKPESCELAFMKMDNVLIDDRRIHVDFSQSVSKNYQWQRQTRGPAPNEGRGSKPRNLWRDEDEKPRRDDERHRHSSSARHGSDSRRGDLRHRDEREGREHKEHHSRHHHRHHHSGHSRRH